MRTRHIPHAAVLFVNVIQCEPHGDCLARIEHEIVTVLVRRGRLSDGRRLVEVLHVLWHDRTAQQYFGGFSKTTDGQHIVEPGIMFPHLLDLFQRRGVITILIKDVLRRQPGNDVPDESIDLNKQFL